MANQTPRNQEAQIGIGWEGAGCPVLARGTTAEYRRALAWVVRPSDIAVEIGSAAGVTTIQLARKCTRAIGVDMSPSQVAGAIKNNQDSVGFGSNKLYFVVAKVHHGDDCEESLEPLKRVLNSEQEQEQEEHKAATLLDVTLLAIDVAGTIPLEQITPLIVALRRVMRPRVTVVKSLALKKLLVAMEAGESLLEA